MRRRTIFAPIICVLALLAGCASEETLPYQDGEPKPLPVLLFATEGLTFGNITQACGDAERKFCVENRSVVALAVEDLGVTHDEPTPDFRISDIDGGLSISELRSMKLEPGARLCFQVIYEPREPGIDNAEVFVKLEGFAEPLTVEIGGTTDATTMNTDTFEQGGTTKVDFLFVLDNSPSMSDVNIHVRRQLEQMFDQIELMYDYRVAVTTADPAYVGQLVPYTDPSAQIITRTLPDARETFASSIRVASAGSNEIRAFESAFRLFSNRGFDPDDFLRTDAILVLIWVSDRDDMSDGPPELYASFFARVPQNRMQFVMSLAFVRNGFDPTSCWANDPPSAFGTRFGQLGGQLFSTGDSVCSDFYANALFNIPGSMGMGFFQLSSVPKQETLMLKVRLQNGDEQDPPSWRYEPSARAIVFDFQQPPIGSTLIATYEVDCE